MNSESKDRRTFPLRTVLRASQDALRRDLAEHPSSETLLEYHEGALSEDEAEALRDHLALCGDCAGRALDLADFVEPDASGAKRPPKDASGSGWEGMRATLEEEGLLGGRIVKLSPPARLLRSPRLAYALAAAAVLFAATTLTLTLELKTLREASAYVVENGTYRDEPRVGIRLIDLFPEGSAPARSAASEGELSEPEGVGDDTQRFVFILNLLDPGKRSRYRAEIVGDGGETVWTSPPFSPSPAGDLTVELSRRRLPQGPSRILLYAVGEEGEELVATYVLPLGAR